MRRRVMVLAVAGLLVAGAVMVRVWLAATGGYSQGGLAVPLRVVSAVALVGGFVLAGAAVAWPVRKPLGPTERVPARRDDDPERGER